MIRNQRGQGMVEYILILALVVVGAIGLWISFGNKTTDMLESANGRLDDAKKELATDRARK